jgi:hypothetical protein
VRNGTHTSHSCVCLSSATLSNQSHVVSFSRDTPKPTRAVDSLKPCRPLFPKRRPVRGAARSEIFHCCHKAPEKASIPLNQHGFPRPTMLQCAFVPQKNTHVCVTRYCMDARLHESMHRCIHWSQCIPALHTVEITDSLGK